jgi:hypothetical protein
VKLRTSAAVELEALPDLLRNTAVDTIAALAQDPLPKCREELGPKGTFRITRENCVIVYNVEADRSCAVVSRVRARGAA